jgi:hypothetical protein
VSDTEPHGQPDACHDADDRQTNAVEQALQVKVGWGRTHPHALRRDLDSLFWSLVCHRSRAIENVSTRLDRGESGLVPELTLGELVALYLERHAASVRPRTILELRKRLRYAVRAFGDVPLRDLEHMSGEIASWRTRLPERSRYGPTGAQTDP